MYINGPERINALKIQDLAFNSCMTRNTSTCKNSEKSYRRFSFQAKFVNTASRGVDLTQHCNLDHKFLSRPLPKVAMGTTAAQAFNILIMSEVSKNIGTVIGTKPSF